MYMTLMLQRNQLLSDTLSEKKAKLLIFSNLEKQGLEKGSISNFEVKNSSIQKLE